MVLGGSNTDADGNEAGSELKEWVVMTSLLQKAVPVLCLTRQTWNSRRARATKAFPQEAAAGAEF